MSSLSRGRPQTPVVEHPTCPNCGACLVTCGYCGCDASAHDRGVGACRNCDCVRLEDPYEDELIPDVKAETYRCQACLTHRDED